MGIPHRPAAAALRETHLLQHRPKLKLASTPAPPFSSSHILLNFITT